MTLKENSPMLTGEFIYEPLEVNIFNRNNFLKIRETLTRIGVESYSTQTLYQSCHIIYDQGKYYIAHFKELLSMDGRKTSLNEDDLKRRNAIAKLLEEWNLLYIINRDILNHTAPVSTIKIIPYRDKMFWTLTPKYIKPESTEEINER